jgi:DNA mismatch endonuclease (patch repair protein)
MQKQRSRDTAPEIALRRELHLRGLRFRVHRPIVPGTRRTVDIAFGNGQVAVDVRGCYWHGHEHDRGQYVRTQNLHYWTPKIEGNMRRDADTERRLEAAGWLLVIVWECEPVATAADRVAAVLSRRRRALSDRVPPGHQAPPLAT